MIPFIEAPVDPFPALRGRFEAHLRACIDQEQRAEPPEARLAWRLSRYDNGLKLLALARALGVRVETATVLDAGGAFGGDVLPFAASGATALVTDWLDHHFAALTAFAEGEGLKIGTFPADAMRLPLREASVDLVLSLDVVEHLPDVHLFAGEVARVLKPDGLALVTTPPRWRFLARDPHYGVPLLHALPMSWRDPVARRVFGSEYPYAVYRIYGSAQEAAAPFECHGLKVEAMMPFSEGAERWRQRMPTQVFAWLQSYAWDILVVRP